MMIEFREIGWDVEHGDPKHPEDIPACDVVLAHCYRSQWPAAKPRAVAKSRLTASYLEIPLGVDLPFLMLPGSVRGTSLPFPCPRGLAIAKTPADGSGILLDHPWPTKDAGWTQRLYDALRPLARTTRIAQMERGRGLIPEWIERVPIQRYEDYLAATADFGYFVMTHHGSYNAALVDMAARGMTCMAAREDGLLAHFKFLGVRPIATAEDVVSIVSAGAATDTPTMLTPLREAVAKMHAAFMTALGEA